MRIGIFGGDTQTRTIDQVVADAKKAEADGFASFWLPQIFGLDAISTLAIVGPLLRQGNVSFAGETLTAHTPVMVADRQPVPVLLAALAPRMLKLAGGVADGTVTWMTGRATLADYIVPSLESAAKEAGRPTPRVCASLPVCITNDPDGARTRAA